MYVPTIKVYLEYVIILFISNKREYVNIYKLTTLDAEIVILLFSLH